MTDSYNKFAKTFSVSRKNMRWEELDYFMKVYGKSIKNGKILDIWCGSGRLLAHINRYFKILPEIYTWVDISDSMLNEAKKQFPEYCFMRGDMKNISSLCHGTYQSIFLIASFHHLENLEDRKKVLLSLYNSLEEGWSMYMTNWALCSSLNKKKYANSRLKWSENNFGSSDYSIKIWDYNRFYHSFSLKELESLVKEAWFSIQENRLFENEKNIITICIKK